MVRRIAVVLLVGATLSAVPAFAVEGRPYASVTAGATFLADSDFEEEGDTIEAEFDTGYNVGAALGYDFGPGRMEAEIAYRSNEFDKFTYQGVSVSGDGTASALSFMVNGYLDFKNQSAVTPFVTAGLGFANVDVDDVEVAGVSVGSEDDTVFAYQLGAGLGIALNKEISLDLSYKYFATSDPEFDGTEAEYDSHNINVGLRFSF